MKVGTLARKTGLTIRTLHDYEEVGLLVPAQRTDAGHRLYGADEVVRLQKVVLLRQLGFSLEEIRACLDQPDYSLYRVIQLHRVRLKQQIDLQQQIYRRPGDDYGPFTGGGEEERGVSLSLAYPSSDQPSR